MLSQPPCQTLATSCMPYPPPYFRASSDVFRTMLRIRLKVPVPAAQQVKACVCGMTGPPIKYGHHWLRQCQQLSYNTVRHNAVHARACTVFLRGAGYDDYSLTVVMAQCSAERGCQVRGDMLKGWCVIGGVLYWDEAVYECIL